jgi:hypothetical protein
MGERRMYNEYEAMRHIPRPGLVVMSVDVKGSIVSSGSSRLKALHFLRREETKHFRSKRMNFDVSIGDESGQEAIEGGSRLGLV